MVVDLNADLGDIPGEAGAALDDAMLDLVTSANVACGGHAGDDASMRRVAALAAERGIVIGAHVSYPDRLHFGRRPVALEPGALLDSLRSQLDDLLSAGSEAGAPVRYLKAHGALYNSSVVSDAPAALLVSLAEEFALPLLTLRGGRLARLAEVSGVAWYAEFFADRAYDATGALLPRTVDGAVIADQERVAARALTAVERGVVAAHDGTEVVVDADSICLHGDTAGAVGLARSVRGALARAPVTVASFLEQGR